MRASSDLTQGLGFQIFATLIADLLAITDGMTMGWTSPMIPYFLSEKSHIKMTMKEAEFIETSALIGSVVGLPITAYLVGKLGRRKALILSTFLLIWCWLAICLADRVIIIYVARFLKGLGLNMAFVAMPMYIGEISHRKIRGLLTASTFIFMLIGIVAIYSLGPYVPYYIPPILGMVLLAIEFVTFFFLPESPSFLIDIGKYDEAKKSLQMFRGKANIDEELMELQTATDKSVEESGGLKDLLMVKNNRRAMFIIFTVNFTQLFGGFEVILMNLQQILDSAGSIYFDSSIVAIIFSVVMLVSAIASSTIVDRFGRKILLMISIFTSGLCTLTLAIYFNLKELDYDVERVSWIPIVAVMSYALCFKIGLGTVPIVLTAEIFSQKIKAIGMTLGDGAYVVSSIAALQVYFYLKEHIGMHVPFYIFSAWLFTVTPYIFFCIPETKGKSLDEIQEILKR